MMGNFRKSGCLAAALILFFSSCTSQEKHSAAQGNPATDTAAPASSQTMSDEQLSALALTQVETQLTKDGELLPSLISSNDDVQNLVNAMLSLLKKIDPAQLKGMAAAAFKAVDTNGDNQIDQDELNAAIARITEKAGVIAKRAREMAQESHSEFCSKIAEKIPADTQNPLESGNMIYAPLAAMHCLTGDKNSTPGEGMMPPFDFADFCQNRPTPTTTTAIATTTAITTTTTTTTEDKALGLHAESSTQPPPPRLNAWLTRICQKFQPPPPLNQPATTVDTTSGVCCKAATLDCLACSAGITPKDYCSQNPKQAGCETIK